MPLDRRQFLAAMAASLAPGAVHAQGLGQRPPRKTNPAHHHLVAMAGLPGTVAYALLAGHDVLASAQALRPMAPASTMKAITACYALDRLGPRHRFVTRIIRSGDMLVLAGGGDPVLSTDDLAQLAATASRKVGRPPSRFTVWGGALPSLPAVAAEQAVHLAYNPSVSGMILNFNRVHLNWTRVGAEHQIRVEARATAHSPRAFTISARPGSQTDVFTYRHDTEHEFWTMSRSAIGRTGSRWLPVRLPELYAGDVFQTLCRAQGLALPAPEVLTDLPRGEVLAVHESPPLPALIRDMLRYSTNITAEAIGLSASGAGDLAASAERMRHWLRAAGREMHLVDHSGLSDRSRLSALDLSHVLAGPGRDLKLRPLLNEEPLREDLAPAAARHRVAAKTGTLNFVSNLAGYVSTSSRTEGVFAILCADAGRRAATVGHELPPGVRDWTRQAKSLQRNLLASFADRLEV